MNITPMNVTTNGLSNLQAAQSMSNNALGRMLGQNSKNAAVTPVMSQTEQAAYAGNVEAADAAKVVGNARDQDDANSGPDTDDFAKGSADYARASVLEQAAIKSILIGRDAASSQTQALLDAVKR